MLPLPVLEKAAADLVCYGDSGMSVMEMSHRSPAFEAIITEAEALLRQVMNIGEPKATESTSAASSTNRISDDNLAMLESFQKVLNEYIAKERANRGLTTR